MLGDVPHVLQPVDGQQVRRHGEVQLVDERSDLRRRIQQVDDGAAQVVQLRLQHKNRSEINGRDGPKNPN